jgi:phosphoglycerate dehydrogenase-like enzyme
MVAMTAVRRTRAAVARSAADAIRARAPDSAEVLIIEDAPDLGTIDFLVPDVGKTDVLDEIPGMTELSVVQVLTAGVDGLEEIVPPKVTLCSARGARDGPVVEWILGALLGACTGLLQRATVHGWNRRQPRPDLGGWTVLIVGLGSIGLRLRSRLQELGTTVVGVASHARDGAHAISELEALLPTADAVVLLTPLTDATVGLIGAAELAAMRDGALLVNAARGPVIDTDALLPEVASGRLRAVLDVTDPEPLPDGHPLWTAPGVLCITPHMAGNSQLAAIRSAEFAGDQLARWCAGEELLNIIRRGTP